MHLTVGIGESDDVGRASAVILEVDRRRRTRLGFSGCAATDEPSASNLSQAPAVIDKCIVARLFSEPRDIWRNAMTVYIFRNLGRTSKPLQQSLAEVSSRSVNDIMVWNFSTYYGTKSPDCKLTSKEALSIICPHIFVGAAPIIAKPQRRTIFESEIEKIAGFVGVLHGKLAREHVLRLVRIVRRKREKLRLKEILELSIYDCIADGEKNFGLYQEEIDFCDKFIDEHVTFAKERTVGVSSSHSMAG